jgi:uncharacterized protein (DUF1778 family)
MSHTRKNVRRPPKAERLEARVTPEQKAVIARAAALRDSSITEFIVASAEQAAALDRLNSRGPVSEGSRQLASFG